MYYLICSLFITIFFIVCMLSVIYAAEIYQLQHYYAYKLKIWLKSGSIKKYEEQEKIKREIKKKKRKKKIRLKKKKKNKKKN